ILLRYSILAPIVIVITPFKGYYLGNIIYESTNTLKIFFGNILCESIRSEPSPSINDNNMVYFFGFFLRGLMVFLD
ncbi:MAG: hypothetical protein KJ915_00680, partial [Candidatus Omnitrophica bacterium]|nr:hypothetical protein [Candidatus Omnitrophota bacterium]